VIVSSAAGSTAYNASAGGVILPIGTNNIVLTGISPAIYHRFRTIQLSGTTEIFLEPLETEKRPTTFFADGQGLGHIIRAKITLSPKIVRLLYAKSEDYHKKVQDLQFPDWKI
jgi:NAD+ kinase